MKRKGLLVFTAIVVVLLGVYYFSNRNRSNSDTIKIGALLSLTGDNATQGQLAQNGILLYLDKINASGGINGKKVELVIENTQTSTNGTLIAFKKLATIDKVQGIVVTGDTEFKAVNTLANTYKIPIIATICTGMLEEGRSEWLYRYCYNEAQEDECLMKFVKNDMNINELVLLYPNTQFGLDFYKYSKDFIDKNNISILRDVAYDFNSTNQRSEAVKIMDVKPKVICARGFGSALEALLRHIGELGFKGSIVGDLSITTPSIVNNTNGVLEGAYIVASDLDMTSTNKAITDYVSAYKKQYKIDPCFWDAIGYDSFLFLCEALIESGKTSKDIKSALYTIKPQGLLLGNNTFKNKQDVSFDMHIFQLKKGNLVKIK